MRVDNMKLVFEELGTPGPGEYISWTYVAPMLCHKRLVSGMNPICGYSDQWIRVGYSFSHVLKLQHIPKSFHLVTQRKSKIRW